MSFNFVELTIQQRLDSCQIHFSKSFMKQLLLFYTVTLLLFVIRYTMEMKDDTYNRLKCFY